MLALPLHTMRLLTRHPVLDPFMLTQHDDGLCETGALT